MKQEWKYHRYVKAGIVLTLLNTLAYFMVDQPIGMGGFMGWTTSHLVYLVNKAYATGNLMFHFFIFTFDSIACVTMGFACILGACIHALLTKKFKFRIYSKAMCLRSFIGGLFIGISFALMRGGNVIHVFGGLPQFVASGYVVLVGLFIGAYLGRKVIVR